VKSVTASLEVSFAAKMSVDGSGKSIQMAPPSPVNSLVCPLLTDMYQMTMTYAHWKNRHFDDHAVFDLFFRKSPFDGEYAIFAGSYEILSFVANFKITVDDVEYLKTIMKSCEPEFFDWLLSLDCSRIKIYAMKEGSVVFPREPLLRIEGPLAVGQLLETTLLNLVNFPSLVATNACRMRLAAGTGKSLMEFGLRRAQGPDGGLTASKYAYVGVFDGTSNVLAGKLFGIPVKGTHAHAYVQAYSGLSSLTSTKIASGIDGSEIEFVSLVMEKRKILKAENTNEGELAAFISYAQAFPNGVLALVDTYDILSSGVPNFLCVAWALYDIGYKPLGIRLDSGDLAYFSKAVRAAFRKMDATCGKELFGKLQIVASNDINEDVLLSLNREGHEIDTFGIGTHLVTCQKQPALGCVYKLVEINGNPRIKLSQDVEKLVIPCKKDAFRLFGADGHPIVDIMTMKSEKPPTVGDRIMCRHPFQPNKRCFVTPSIVEPLLQTIWDGQNGGIIQKKVVLTESRNHCITQVASMRNDHIRSLNATPYKISLSEELYEFMHALWMRESPVVELK